jgi:hypothetical protein
MIGNVFDLEADGLIPKKIHCISLDYNGKIISTTDYDKMRSFFSKADILVGHNIQRYDIPALKKLLGVDIKAMLIDTLALSWYLFPNRLKHGLEEWGEEFGIPKPPIDDWENLTPEEYIHRCEQDVEINRLLWELMWKRLLNLYESEGDVLRFLKYIEFKMECAREQEAYGWKLDVELATKLKEEWLLVQQEKIEELKASMPKVLKKDVKNKPAKCFKKTGDLSEAGKAWFALLDINNLPREYDGPVEYIKKVEEPNPNSPEQIKQWLFSLGWKPETFAYKRTDTGETRKIPQVQQDKAKGEGLCPSVIKLFEKEPALEVLQGLSIISHRIGIVNGFLENVDENGYVQAKIAGLTNTLRFKHSVLVNLPGVDKPYGRDIRSCLVAPDGYLLGGSDMTALEDNTGRHYMFDYDPKYVEEMSRDDYDPHLDLALVAGKINRHQIDDYLSGNKDKGVVLIRKKYKVGNYACKYGAMAKKLSLTLGISLEEAQAIVDAYWKRNWSVKAVAEACEVKVCNGGMWLFNPVSKFWYSLRREKDRFSTLNQGTGVFCFDTYLKYTKRNGPPIIGQFHDEYIALVKESNKERFRKHVNKAIQLTNEELGLNVELKVGLDFGNNYSEIH